VKDGISFLRNLEANTTCNRSSLLSQQKDVDLEITCGGAGNIDDSQFETVDEDITVNMEMTRSYENWQLKMSPVQSKTSRNDSSFHFVKKVQIYKSISFLPVLSRDIFSAEATHFLTRSAVESTFLLRRVFLLFPRLHQRETIVVQKYLLTTDA
jgi:hypothetical protein